MLDRVQLGQPAPRTRRLLLRLCLFAFCGGLLLLLSSRPAGAAERREPRLLGPVSTTLKATAREVDSFAGRATGSGTSTATKAATAARQLARSAATSPVRRAAPSTRPATSAARTAARSGARLVTSAATRAVARAAKLTANPTARAAEAAGGPLSRVGGDLCGAVDGHANLARRCATLPLRGAEPGTGSLAGARLLAPVGDLTGPVLGPFARALAPVGSALAPVGSVLAPVVGPAGGLVPPVVPGGLLPLPGLGGSGAGVSTGAGAPASGGIVAHGPGGGFANSSGAPADAPSSSQTDPARPAADGASSPAARSIRSWPALTGAVSLPGSPASAELPAGGPDPLSSSWGAGLGMAALTAALVLLGPIGRGRARPDRSGIISRSYLPAVSPA